MSTHRNGRWPRTLKAGISAFCAIVLTVLSATLSKVATSRTVQNLVAPPGWLRGAEWGNLPPVSRYGRGWGELKVHVPLLAEMLGARERGYGSMAMGTPTCLATGVQMSVSTPGVSMDTTRAYRAPRLLRSRLGWSFHQPLTG
jgi:hypothetical protein